MVNNHNTNIDVKHHVVHDAMKERIAHIVFVETKEQDADILTKTFDAKAIGLHVKALMNAK